MYYKKYMVMGEFLQPDCLTPWSAGKWLNLIFLSIKKETAMLIIRLGKYQQLETQHLRSSVSYLIS